MLDIELIFDASCPNVEAARAQLKDALHHAGLNQRWKEWNTSESSTPSYTYGYGSPTILVNGLDVAGEQPDESISCCRLYEDKSGKLKGVPPVEAIVQALLQAKKRQ
jgi:mercuric ion transport protein